ncbi:LysM domain-containing GPI-anchored protein 1 [Ancistrocladus abbreviatus]
MEGWCLLISSRKLIRFRTLQFLVLGRVLSCPLPCTCFNGTDDSLPAVYLSYVVKDVDTLAGIAARYSTTVTDLQNVNAMGSTAISPGDILAVPLSACASNFPRYASDYGLIVPNGSYAITASHCVQCSCGPGSSNLYCMPASLAVSCSSMQCRNSNLMLGNVTVQHSSAGCNVTSCSYTGFVNGTIMTTLSTSLEPQCPGVQQLPPLTAPPTAVTRESLYAPSPAPSESGSPGSRMPGSAVVPPSGSIPGFTPASGPTSSIPGNAASACSLVHPVPTFNMAIALVLLVKFML